MRKSYESPWCRSFEFQTEATLDESNTFGDPGIDTGHTATDERDEAGNVTNSLFL